MIENNNITYSMEDYLEMIGRLISENQIVRISVLAEKLHVRSSSASKMVANLKNRGLVSFEKYGFVTLTEKGSEISGYLLKRHDILNRFLCHINKTNDELEQVEKIEHYMNRKTIENIENILKRIGK